MLEAAGEQHLAGKVLVDVANPLDVTQGPPPSRWPYGRDEVDFPLERQTCAAFGRREHPTRFVDDDVPAEQACVEPAQDLRLGSCEHGGCQPSSWRVHDDSIRQSGADLDLA